MKSFIVGTGGFAAEVYEWLNGTHAPIDFGGFVAKNRENANSPLKNINCICEEDVPKISQVQIFIAIGDPWKRQEVATNIRKLCPLARFPNLIHPSAIVSEESHMACGNLILPFTIICTRSRMGSFNILNLYSSLGHDAEIGDFCTLSPYATLNGAAKCEDMAFIGSHATVAPGITLKHGSILSANSLATKNVAPNGLAFGVPAKSLKSLE